MPPTSTPKASLANPSAAMHMVKDKETKGTVVFREQTAPDVRPHTFYILKDLYEELGRPSEIEVTIETD